MLFRSDLYAQAVPFGSLVVGGSSTIRFDGTGVDISAVLAPLAAGKTLTLDLPNSDVSFATGLSGAGSIVKVGAFKLNLAGASSLTAASTVLVSAGKLQLNGAGTLGAATLSIDGGEFINNSSASDLANPIRFEIGRAHV